jgi:type I restriction enzyme S subunit
MAGDRVVVTLEELASSHPRSIAMGPFGSNIRKENYRLSGVPVIRGFNLDAERFADSGFVFLSEEKADELKSSNAFPGDIVFIAQGTVGRVGIVPRHSQYARYVLSQNLMKVTCDPDKADPLFVFYYFRSVEGQQEILSRVNPTGVPCISQPLTSLRSFKVNLPPLTVQRRIAHILGTLDDKIEHNRRTNATLEGMSRALFKSWFVDFDPVRAKADGRAPAGMSAELAALFPDSFEDSPLGKVPRGWGVKSFGDFTNRVPVGRKYDQKTVSSTGKVPVLDQGKSGIIGYHDDEPGVVAAPDNPIAVFANHTCYMRLITFPFSAIQNVLPFVGSNVNTIWAYYATLGEVVFSEYKGHWPDFVIQETVVPPKELTESFAYIVSHWIKRIAKNEEQTRTLAALRDALLPKLLSGAVGVGAEGIITQEDL